MAYLRSEVMDIPRGKTRVLRKDFVEWKSEMAEYVSLKDVPLEIRRKEARKPLFLTRYE